MEMISANRGSTRKLILTSLLVALGGLLLAELLIPGGDSSLEINAPAVAPTSGLVDQKPLLTARSLASLAATKQEEQYATQALRIADHEVDLAFETALREATSQAPVLSGKALALQQQIEALEQQVKDDQQLVDRLTRPAGATQTGARTGTQSATGPDAETPSRRLGDSGNFVEPSEELQLAQAQLEDDRDELDDRHQDLIAVGGDGRAKIQQALDEYEAVQKQAEATPPKSLTAALESPESLQNLPGKFRAYLSLSDRMRQLAQARWEALNNAVDLGRKHEALGKQTESQSAAKSALRSAGNPPPDATSRSTALLALKTLAGNRQTLTGLDRRIQDEHQLAVTYDAWSQLAATQRRAVLRQILGIFAIILVLISAVYVVVLVIETFFDRTEADGRRRQNMRLVLSLGAQALGVILILLVIFGPPRETPTILGLATAGFTVVMKDFIVAFFGWFALISKNGIRVGDWVEINGVSGEVVEVGVFRTKLLETGNWTEAGHPTGRRVSFMNGFAIEGQYFNFSTTGQWLWDELSVVVPAGEDAHKKVEEIRKAVVDLTKVDSELAEREWKSVRRTLVPGTFSAQPVVELRPDVTGIQVVVRYLTRAHERLATRARLYAELIRILHFSNALPEPNAEKFEALLKS